MHMELLQRMRCVQEVPLKLMPYLQSKCHLTVTPMMETSLRISNDSKRFVKKNMCYTPITIPLFCTPV